MVQKAFRTSGVSPFRGTFSICARRCRYSLASTPATAGVHAPDMLRNLEIVPSTESWTELLDWVNCSMPAEAPNRNKTPMMRRVEDCGRGVPYVLMLPSMLPIIHTPLLTSRVKVPAKTDYEAVANFKIMHDALRRNGIVIPAVLASGSQRLVDRNFQANLHLLQWFRGLSTALQQCGIEAGEGRIVLEPPSCDDSMPSLGSPPASVVRAESRRRPESVHRAKSEAEVQWEMRVAESQGDAATAAALALLRDSRSLSHHRSRSPPSQFASTTLTSTRSEPYAGLSQHMPAVLQPPPPRHDVADAPAQPSAAATAPPPRPPVTGPRTIAVKQVTKPAAPPSQPRTAVEHAPTPTERRSARDNRPVAAAAAAADDDAAPAPAAAPPPAPEVQRPPSPAPKPAAPSAAPQRRSSLSRRPSDEANGSRVSNHVDNSAPGTRARTPATGRGSHLIFKAVPARLSVSDSATRRASSKAGGTPRGTEAGGKTPRSAMGSRRASTPKKSAGTAANGEKDGAPPAVARRPKGAAKPIIAVNTTTAAPPKQTRRTPRHAEAVLAEAVPAAAPAASAPASVAEAPAAAPAAPAVDVDVAQLQIDRQFYYDKLRSIEELVDCMEAKKKQERAAAATAWDAKDDEMVDFAQSVRSVLYAES